MGRMLVAALTLVVFLAALGAGGASAGADTFVTVKQAQTRFEAASGYPLLRNPKASAVGRYVALDLGVETISKRVTFGRFVLYLVVERDARSQVDDLLADTHTGRLGRPDARGIHWERGLTLDGRAYWLAKKRYGVNLVLWWYGSAAKKTDRAFANLNALLLRLAAART